MDSFYTIHSGKSYIDTVEGKMFFDVIVQMQMKGGGVDVIARNPAQRLYKQRLSKPKLVRLLGGDDTKVRR